MKVKKILYTTAAMTALSLCLCACGDDDDKASLSSKLADATGKTEDTGSNPQSESEKPGTDPALSARLAELADEEVDEEWMEVLEANGSFYDAFYNLRKIMKEEEPNHPDDVKMPDGIIKDNNDYYIPDMQLPETTSVDSSEIIGRWIPVYSMYQDIQTDFTWAREAGVDFHLDLNEDGTTSCNIIDGEQKGTWNDKTIPINGKDCTYGMEDDYLVLRMNIAPGLDMVYAFERDEKNNSFVRAHEDDESGYLGHKLKDAKVYRLVQTVDGNDKKKADPNDPELSPEDHFIVLVETDEEYHSGYGYIRNGITDTAIYYQGDRGIFKLINEDTTDRGGGMGRRKYELKDDDKVLGFWPGYQNNKGRYDVYELCEGEEAPISHLAVGPNPDRNFEIPEGTHEKAGFYRIDKMYNYTYVATDPLMLKDYQAGGDDNVYGTDTRKYDADFWYVLRDDGTGYMRAWNRYFEIVWSDDVQYYYDISGKHQLSVVVGELDYDGTFMRMFKDEINPVPEYPEELTYEGAKKLKEEIEKKREERNKDKE